MNRKLRENVLERLPVALILILGLFLVTGCRTKQVVVVEKEIVKVEKRDSIIHRDSTVYVPFEKIVEVVKPMDTLIMETSLAISKSWMDTSLCLLKGELKNLKAVQIKYIEIEKVTTNDSIVEKEVPTPYPVEVTKTPKWAWWTLVFSILVLGFIGIKVYLKFKPF